MYASFDHLWPLPWSRRRLGVQTRPTRMRFSCVALCSVTTCSRISAWVERAVWLVWPLPHQLRYCHTNISHFYHCWPLQKHNRYRYAFYVFGHTIFENDSLVSTHAYMHGRIVTERSATRKKRFRVGQW